MPFSFMKLVLFVVIFSLGVVDARASDRWALILGVQNYVSEQIPDLDNTVNDARVMASTLLDQGFEVYYLEDPSKAEIEAKLDEIAAEEAGAELGLFFFAGHGLQVGGENYALPADIRIEGENFVEEQGVSIGSMIRQMGDFGTRQLVVILDACRDSPFPDQGSTGTGLALVDAPENTIIAYSTAPGAIALDGVGGNSPYTAALASALNGSRQGLRDVLRLVRARVKLATGGAQTPWFVDNFREEITLVPAEPAPAIVDGVEVSTDEISLATTLWRTIAGSRDPRDFDFFEDQFPQNALAAVAREQSDVLARDIKTNFPLVSLKVPSAASQVAGGLGTITTACDLLATGVGSVLAIAEEVPHDLVNTRVALRACIAAVRDDPENPRLLGYLARVLRLDDRYEEALHFMEQAAARGNPGAYGGIAEIYRLGLGVEEDQVAAANAVRAGALLGAPAQRVQLGIYYREGWGVEQSNAEALKWLELAVQSHSPAAMNALGDMYRRGRGVEQDFERALGYYQTAAALGSSDAMNNIGMAYMRGQGVETNTDIGIRWLTRATDEGNPYSAFHLGRAFVKGWGVERNQAQGVAYFKLSAQRNYLGAYTALGDTLSADGAGDEDLSEALANYIIATRAAELKDTRKSLVERDEINEKITALDGRLTDETRAAGEKVAQDWIDQFGVLDFNLVHE